MTPRSIALRALSFDETSIVPVAGGLMQHVPFMAGVLGISEARWWEAPRANLFAACREIGCHAILGPVMPKRPDETTTDAQGRPTDFRRVARRRDMLRTPEAVADCARQAPSPEEVRAQFDTAGTEALFRERSVDAQREAGEPREALVTASETWPLFVPLLILLYLPGDLAYRPVGLTTIPSDAERLVGHTITEAAMVLQLALFLVPWVIIDRRVGMRAALAQTWAVATDRASDLMAFVLRYVAAFAVMMVVIDVLAPWGYQGPLTALSLVRTLSWGPVELLGTLAIGVLCLSLREETGPAIAKKPSDTPDAGGSEDSDGRGE